MAVRECVRYAVIVFPVVVFACSMEDFKDKMYGCYNPYRRTIKLEHSNRIVTINCPCGKCYNCLRNYEKTWTMRMREEMANARSSYFLTLTYAPEHVPIGDNELLLCKSDYQKFLKRVRKRLSRCDISLRYVVVGEYGSNTSRPHYHMALFLDNKIPFNDFHKIIETSWDLGFIELDFLNVKRIKYLVKYFNKLDTREHTIKYFRNMSNGIGKCFLTPRTVKYYKETLTTICKRYGYTYPMPRYYKDKIFDEIDKENLLIDAEVNYRSWLSAFHARHGRVRPVDHYKEVNETKLNRACINGHIFTDDDSFMPF